MKPIVVETLKHLSPTQAVVLWRLAVSAVSTNCSAALRRCCRQTLAGRFLVLAAGAQIGNSPELHARDVTNQPPTISFLWPVTRPGVFPSPIFSFGTLTYVKLKTNPVDTDGAISGVRFFAGTNLIGTVTSPPYNLVWTVPRGFSVIRAVAVDNYGLETETHAGRINGLTGRPPDSYVEIVWPPNGMMYAAPATFEFAAEVLAGSSGMGPIEFLVDDSSVGQNGSIGALAATTPPITITVTNLPLGDHTLGIRYLGTPGCWRCYAVTNNVRVVRLGLHSPEVRPDGTRQFEVATSYPGKRHVIEASEDLLDWCIIATTNAPVTNSFTFVIPGGAAPDDRYYRVLVPEP